MKLQESSRQKNINLVQNELVDIDTNCLNVTYDDYEDYKIESVLLSHQIYKVPSLHYKSRHRQHIPSSKQPETTNQGEILKYQIHPLLNAYNFQEAWHFPTYIKLMVILTPYFVILHADEPPCIESGFGQIGTESHMISGFHAMSCGYLWFSVS